MSGECEWKSKQDRTCPLPGTIKVGDRWLCSGHADCHSSEQGEHLLDDILEYGVLPPSDLSRQAQARTGQQTLSMDRVTTMYERRRAKVRADALAIYRSVRQALEQQGIDRHQAHEQAVAEVYSRGRCMALDRGRLTPATPYGQQRDAG